MGRFEWRHSCAPATSCNVSCTRKPAERTRELLGVLRRAPVAWIVRTAACVQRGLRAVALVLASHAMKRFREHLRTCAVCRANPAGICAEAARVLLDEALPRMVDVAAAQREEVRRSGTKRFPRGPRR